MSFHVIIPARLGSTRLAHKVLADIGGRPMIVRVAEQAQASGATEVVVATDSSTVVDACAQFGITALLSAREHACGTDRIAEAVKRLGLTDDAIVVNVQGDEPLICPKLIRNCAEHLIERESLVMSTAAHPITEAAEFWNPNIVKVVCNQRSEAIYFSRAPIAWWRDGFAQGEQNLLPQPLTPLRHVGLYAYRAGFLREFAQLASTALEQTEVLEQLRALWYGYAIGVHITETIHAAGVDTEEDLKRVRQVLERSPPSSS